VTGTTGRIPRWAIAGLVAAMVFNVAWRWHTIGPTVLSRPFEGRLVRSGATEPLDCDEAAYAYMGRRMIRGDVLYRDLTENKPPLGYWLYGLAVAVGGADEFAIRVMPIPYILATIAAVWWIGLTLAGPWAACLAAFVFGVAVTDPYLFGNGANLEHFLNLFSVGSLGLFLLARRRSSRRLVVACGVCLGLSALVKQVAATHGLVYAAFLLLPDRGDGKAGRSLATRCLDLAALAIGSALPWLASLAVLAAQGAGHAAYEDIVVYARAMVTDLPAAPNAPPWYVRLVAGNADPQGKLPWPFGATRYYAWWGAGLWPFWLASLPATARLVSRRSPMIATEAGSEGQHGSSTSARASPLLAAWTLSSWLQILLPGQFWQHYYLLAVPGSALAVSIWAVDAIRGVRSRPVRNSLIAAGLIAALGWSLRIQARDYLGLTPEEITSEFKGGKQWVALRTFGRDLAVRAKAWDDPHLFVWGWQSPLFLYSGLDGVSRHFFANELIKAHATDDHPLVRRWVGEILRDLEARPPAIVLAGDIPFPALRKFLDARYLPSPISMSSPDGRGLWVEKGRFGAFHARGASP